jgi:copper(I)-binding protein
MVRPALLLGLALAATACTKEEEGLRVDGAYVRFSPVRANPSAAYFTIHGGPQDVSLIGVSTEVAIRTEMHETMSGHQGMSSMKPVTNVQIPAGSEIKFEPGGKHVMFWNMNPGLKPGRNITLIFAFSNGEKLQVSAPLVAAGQAVPEK